MFFKQYLSKPNFHNTIGFCMFLQREIVFIKSEQNRRFPDATYISNDSINVLILSLMIP